MTAPMDGLKQHRCAGNVTYFADGRPRINTYPRHKTGMEMKDIADELVRKGARLLVQDRTREGWEGILLRGARAGHLFDTFCTSGQVAMLQRGAVGNHILLHFPSQFVYRLLQTNHVFSRHSCAVHVLHADPVIVCIVEWSVASR